jgi:NAD(P)-dependent dehydrogenase (short-subunit alcohol dehydrogenase family)
MAKAALNMLTHTAAGELAKSDLYECCGTGWVTDEDPAELAK